MKDLLGFYALICTSKAYRYAISLPMVGQAHTALLIP